MSGSSPNEIPLPSTICEGTVIETPVISGVDQVKALDVIGGARCTGEIPPSSITLTLYLERANVFAFSEQTNLWFGQLRNPISMDGQVVYPSVQRRLGSCPITNARLGVWATCPTDFNPTHVTLLQNFVYWIKMTMTVLAPGAAEPVEYADVYSKAYLTGDGFHQN